MRLQLLIVCLWVSGYASIVASAEKSSSVNAAELLLKSVRYSSSKDRNSSNKQCSNVSLKQEALTVVASLAVLTAALVGVVGGDSFNTSVELAITNDTRHPVARGPMTALQQELAQIYARAGVDTPVDRHERKHITLYYLYSHSPYVDPSLTHSRAKI